MIEAARWSDYDEAFGGGNDDGFVVEWSMVVAVAVVGMVNGNGNGNGTDLVQD